MRLPPEMFLWRGYSRFKLQFLVFLEWLLEFFLEAGDTPGEFFRRSRRCGSCDKIDQPDGLVLLAIRSNDRRKLRERTHLASAGEFNRRYLTCQISAILYADCGDRRKSQSLHRAHLAIFSERVDRRIKSPSVSLA